MNEIYFTIQTSAVLLWVILTERRLARIEGYCKARTCKPENGT